MTEVQQDNRPPTPAETLDTMLENFAWWPDGAGAVIDMSRPEGQPMTFASFANTVAHLSWTNEGKRVNPANAWRDSPERRIVHGVRFDPTTTDRLVEHHGQEFVNIYRGLPYGDGEADPDAVQMFEDFMAHLVPDERERDWLTQWLAAKVQRPWQPNAAVIMVHQDGGAGRGNLFEMLRGIFSRYMAPISNAQLMGEGGQGSYNDWLAGTLLVTCDEVLSGGDGDGAFRFKRQKCYERLKFLADPASREMPIIRKNLPNYMQRVYASFLLATNNPNALPLSPTDRRFTVISNGDMLQSNKALFSDLNTWRAAEGFKPEFAEAIFKHLRGVLVDWHYVRECLPDTQGRINMLVANEGDAEQALADVLDGVSRDYILQNDLRHDLHTHMVQSQLEAEFPKAWRRVKDILAGPNSTGWRLRPGKRPHVQCPKTAMKRAYVYYRESAGLAQWEDTAPVDRPALWSRKAGNPAHAQVVTNIKDAAKGRAKDP